MTVTMAVEAKSVAPLFRQRQLRAFVFFFSSRRRHTRWNCDWSSDVCSSDLNAKRHRCQGERKRPQGEQAVFLFRRPAGLADGLALKELALHIGQMRFAPNNLGPPPPATNRGSAWAATYTKPRSYVQSLTPAQRQASLLRSIGPDATGL